LTGLKIFHCQREETIVPQTAPPQILLVDDSEICLVVGDLLLSSFGVQVVRAS